MNRKTGTVVVVSAVAVLAVAIVIVAAVAKPKRAAVMTQPQSFSQITLIDKNTGWALSTNGQILRTANGGATWADVSISQTPLPVQVPATIGTCFFDGQTAFVATNAGTDNQPQIVVYRTSDKGSTWDSTNIVTKLDWEKGDIGGVKISFADASNGYLMITGTPGAGQMAKSLYRTTDGGKTFSFVRDITGMTDAAGTMNGIAGYPTGMTFSTPQTGYVTCSYSAYTFVLMFKTTNGGTTWKLWSLPVPAAYENLSPANNYYADAYPPVFFGEQKKTGVVMLDFVEDGNHVMQSYRTTDGGGTWTLGPASNNPDVRTYSFIDATTGWGLNENGKIFTTTDGGATWIPVKTSNP
ncbi:WD40/YVTN/BNR-like repeat-containing protein [Candidatus Cryosericum odellii]|uniref:Photosynthesis system II assembly factor Ycf48/Hcf136-like domain-containing protein n=1 Tax=Candidatus Cryosericum odellii TaxID=2290917 RepID=A0A398DDQ7_9BACT|nr:YCF48-related protein [Candidatus Cryosericum odellii]RIE07436.1 hypothetical protein SMC6_06390 [Candidatus Cryosericum odellii]RIE09351.1 hypothetical protein SMC5_07120 [Candidatus Cryosericum odellii]